MNVNTTSTDQRISQNSSIFSLIANTRIHMLDFMKIEWLANDVMKVGNCLARLGCINSAFGYVEANSRVYVMWTSKGYGLHWLRSTIFLIDKYTRHTQFLRLSVSMSFHRNVQESHIIVQHHISCWQLQSTNYWLLADKTQKHEIPQRNTWYKALKLSVSVIQDHRGVP